jgi:5-methylcytosine-specific restriction endonuclease McrA
LDEFPSKGIQNGKQTYRAQCLPCYRVARRQKYNGDAEYRAKRLEHQRGATFRARERERSRARYQEDPAYRERRKSQVREFQQTDEGQALMRQRRDRRRARTRNVPHEPYNRAELFERWGYSCCYCDAPATDVEHIKPISRGGADALHNLTVACGPCNGSKGAKTLAEWADTF